MKKGDVVFIKATVVAVEQASGNNIVVQTQNGAMFNVSDKDLVSSAKKEKPNKGGSKQ